MRMISIGRRLSELLLFFWVMCVWCVVCVIFGFFLGAGFVSFCFARFRFGGSALGIGFQLAGTVRSWEDELEGLLWGWVIADTILIILILEFNPTSVEINPLVCCQLSWLERKTSLRSHLTSAIPSILQSDPGEREPDITFKRLIPFSDYQPRTAF